MAGEREDSGGDVWEEDADERADLQHEWRVRQQRFQDVGVRDGLDIGQAETSQAGFDSGFRSGLELGRRMSRLHARLKVLRALAPRLAALAELAEVRGETRVASDGDVLMPPRAASASERMELARWSEAAAIGRRANAIACACCAGRGCIGSP